MSAEAYRMNSESEQSSNLLPHSLVCLGAPQVFAA